MLEGLRVAIVARNSVLREGLTAQIRGGGGEVVSLSTNPEAFENPEADIVLIDAGTDGMPELPAYPDGQTRAIVLLAPGARSRLGELKSMGFSGYLMKPVRQGSLFQRLRTREGIAPAPELPAHGEFAQSPPESPPPFASPAAAPATSASLDRGLRKILLIEDNPINAMLSRELLRRRGYAVKDVASGEAALAALDAEDFDVVLTDLHMPGLDGLETTRRLREREQAQGRARTPVVALTADANHGIREACQDAGMDGFLTKPIDPTELDAVLQILFQPAQAA